MCIRDRRRVHGLVFITIAVILSCYFVGLLIFARIEIKVEREKRKYLDKLMKFKAPDQNVCVPTADEVAEDLRGIIEGGGSLPNSPNSNNKIHQRTTSTEMIVGNTRDELVLEDVKSESPARRKSSLNESHHSVLSSDRNQLVYKSSSPVHTLDIFLARSGSNQTIMISRTPLQNYGMRIERSVWRVIRYEAYLLNIRRAYDLHFPRCSKHLIFFTNALFLLVVSYWIKSESKARLDPGFCVACSGLDLLGSRLMLIVGDDMIHILNLLMLAIPVNIILSLLLKNTEVWDTAYTREELEGHLAGEKRTKMLGYLMIVVLDAIFVAVIIFLAGPSSCDTIELSLADWMVTFLLAFAGEVFLFEYIKIFVRLFLLSCIYNAKLLIGAFPDVRAGFKRRKNYDAINTQESLCARDNLPFPLENQIILSLYMHTTISCLLYTSPSPRDGLLSRMPSSA
eukprot:TRINITY_DN20202_c0_g1_i1.p1 TRINITY_DN20202_c0_g1~~TRINITY_DN20202_c0_g1_i1.p1  ORF type:complete len:454 (+),score=125.49 TRINITY_DN20202_c0_g1_i1:63-1424(+)